ncbi:MAG TPA: hypothetical protein VK636_09905, partial [Gemmatimonadaceae bacterium]|nr:hypothetical protein [Gemmatimonadaceae bacterium]
MSISSLAEASHTRRCAQMPRVNSRGDDVRPTGRSRDHADDGGTQFATVANAANARYFDLVSHALVGGKVDISWRNCLKYEFNDFDSFDPTDPVHCPVH